MSINPIDVAARMEMLETFIKEEIDADDPSVLRVIAHLVAIEDEDALFETLKNILTRTKNDVSRWYASLGLNTRDPDVQLALGFLQGVTFAVAAQQIKEEE